MEITGQNQAQPQINVTDQNPQVQSFTPPPNETLSQTPPRKSLFKKLIKILFLFFIFLIFVYMFLAHPYLTHGHPIKPFYVGEHVLSEKVSYLFNNPKKGDRVIFKVDDTNMDFIGVIIDIENIDNRTTYKVASSNSNNPWVITRDKIVAKIYYPFMENKEVLKIVLAQVSPTPTTPPTTDPTGWKTYTNSDMKISFSYPNEEYLLKKESGNEVSFSFLWLGKDEVPESLTISNSKITDVSSIRKCTGSNDEKPDCIYPEIKKIKLGGKNAISFTYAAFGGSPLVVIQTTDEPKVEIRFIILGGGSEKTLDQILSTFKFSDQNQTTDTSAWKTSNVTKLPETSFISYSIKYPNTWKSNEEKNETSNTFILSKGNYSIEIYQAPVGGSGCIFEGEVPEGPFGDYRNEKYTQIESEIEVFRRTKTKDPNSPNNILFSFCAKPKESEYFQIPTSVGGISYKVPLDYKDAVLTEMDRIISTLK